MCSPSFLHSGTADGRAGLAFEAVIAQMNFGHLRKVSPTDMVLPVTARASLHKREAALCPDHQPGSWYCLAKHTHDLLRFFPNLPKLLRLSVAQCCVSAHCGAGGAVSTPSDAKRGFNYFPQEKDAGINSVRRARCQRLMRDVQL